MDMKFYKKYIDLGHNIAYYRRVADYTQMELAELIDADIRTIGNIERARTGVSVDILFRLSEVLNVPVNKFFENRD